MRAQIDARKYMNGMYETNAKMGINFRYSILISTLYGVFDLICLRSDRRLFEKSGVSFPASDSLSSNFAVHCVRQCRCDLNGRSMNRESMAQLKAINISRYFPTN